MSVCIMNALNKSFRLIQNQSSMRNPLVAINDHMTRNGLCNVCVSQQRLISSDKETTAFKPVQKKTKHIPKITLLGLNETISITTLEEAQKLAKRRDLHLKRVQDLDAKTQRSVYKLVTSAEMLSEELEDVRPNRKSADVDKEKRKSEKSLTIGSRISEHDLASRLKNIGKWLSKQHEVRVLIQGSPNEISSCENIAKNIEKSIKEPEVIGKIVQKQTKGALVKFSILPVKTASSSDNGATSNIADKSPRRNS